MHAPQLLFNAFLTQDTSVYLWGSVHNRSLVDTIKSRVYLESICVAAGPRPDGHPRTLTLAVASKICPGPVGCGQQMNGSR